MIIVKNVKWWVFYFSLTKIHYEYGRKDLCNYSLVHWVWYILYLHFGTKIHFHLHVSFFLFLHMIANFLRTVYQIALCHSIMSRVTEYIISSYIFQFLNCNCEWYYECNDMFSILGKYIFSHLSHTTIHIYILLHW